MNKKIQTNADALRNMTDEQLAVMLCTLGWQPKEVDECLEWLKSKPEF